ncbi:hypothetical protein TRAPUB_8891 [Trametes pubescens]|uniref:Uncharacterized protein n=1 Tax=Trametes pubescens TaxID=154538 RepID=A0A1M2W3Y3_TRAPU|nr:hypothetical protein TRAPUB_8891 [Trametes pubescens]
MADTKRTSQIPVMSPRSSSLSSPLGLVPPSRYPSVSGSPTLPTPSPSASSNGGGSTPFRSFRNFLSFGGGRHSSNPNVSALPKGPFTGLGPVRRSVNVERRVSSPQLNSRRSEDDYVLSIDLPRPGGDRSTHTPRSQKSDPGLEPPRTPLSQMSQSSRSDSPNSDTLASPTAPALAATELSTILESETSGISKHLPSLDTSQASHGADSERESEHASPSGFLPPELYHLRPPPHDTRHRSRSPSNDTSPLDLSTSKLTSEVMAAMSASPGKQDWFSGIVVDDTTSESAASRGRTPEFSDMSFNLNTLDPDLAALLSPHRANDTEPALLVAIDAIPPPASSSPPPQSSPPSPRTSLEKPTVTPARRLPPASLSAAPRRPANTTLPRIVRSASDRPAFPIAGKTGLPSPISRTPSGRAASHSPERPSSMGSVTSTQSHHHPQRTGSIDVRRPSPGSASGSMDNRKSAISRLMTPARSSALSPSSSASGSRPPLSRFNSAQGSSVWDAESVSPSSRAPSSVGTAPSRLQEHRPSLDVDRPRSMGTRTRKRSSSVIEHRVTASPSYMTPPVPRATDWLGPRTQKAFAAAGLLDFEKDSPASVSRPGSRFGTTRSSVERERARYTPSRTAFSEAGSSSSWGARSLSRATGYAEMTGGPSRESMSTPRTTFSSASTAPTSISASSSVQQHIQTELQLLQDRHALESGALLNALADSQRTTKLLREENAQLRERLQFLEDKLADAEDRMQQLQYAQPPPPPAISSRSAYGRRFASPALSENRTLPTHSRHGSFLRAQPDTRNDLSSPEPSSHSPETPEDHTEAFPRVHRKRTSVASSVFAAVPNNMSMIMQEEGTTSDSIGGLSMHSSPPGSPTMVLGRVQPPPIDMKPHAHPRPGHALSKSVSSSAGNISPTTANFSMLTGSPGSLNLRPEHERHLGDMPSLDLTDGFEDYDDAGDL